MSGEIVSSMNVGRVATSFVYENQVFVIGGCNSPIIEVLNLNKDSLQWEISEATLSINCNRLRSVVYLNHAVLFCTCSKANNVSKLCLTAPYTCKQFCVIPDPQRKYYTVIAFEHKVLILGGESAEDLSDVLDDVLEFDLTTKEFKAMPSLPRAAKFMAGVRWRDQAVLIGGCDEDGPSKKVLMYDSKTGNTTELPSMLEERSAPAAVITGNTIVVMGGKRQSGRVRSVEAFTLGGYSWRYLSAMNNIRSGATATVLPTKNFH